jgi:hypothetical protein
MKLPQSIADAIRSHIETFPVEESLEFIRRFVRPHRLYRYSFVPGSKSPRYEFVGWRVFLNTKTQNPSALDIVRTKEGYSVSRFYAGKEPAIWLARAREIQKRRKVAAARYERRILSIPAIHTTLLWFAAREHGDSDLFVYLDKDLDDAPKWRTKREVDEEVKAALSASAKLWSAAMKRPATRRRRER